jgi:hypothetical protein
LSSTPYQRRNPMTCGTASANMFPSADTSENPAVLDGESRYVSGVWKRRIGVPALKLGVVVISTAMTSPSALM